MSDSRWAFSIDDYPEQMLTIWYPGVENPFWDFIEGLDDPDRVMDFGCGHGHLAGQLNERLPDTEVMGLDQSETMLDEARRAYPDVRFIQGDMRDLSDHERQLDVATSTNSLLPPEPDVARQMFREVLKTIRPGGLFMGVLPSGDTIEHLVQCRIDQLIDEGRTPEKARQKTHEYYYDRHQFDPERGVYADDPDGEHCQTMWWPEDIRSILHDESFIEHDLQKVYYPWEACKKFGWGYFPDAERVWDWAVRARYTPENDHT